MADAESKVPVKTEDKSAGPPSSHEAWRPFESLRREVDRLFDDFNRGAWRSPFRGSMFDLEPLRWREWIPGTMPAVDIIDKGNVYEVTADLPGWEDKQIEVKVASGMLTIKGEKHEEKDEKKKDYHLQERRFGSFERRFPIPEGVDADKIEASLKKGVLTVTMPKTPEAQKPEKKIAIKSG